MRFEYSFGFSMKAFVADGRPMSIADGLSSAGVSDGPSSVTSVARCIPSELSVLKFDSMVSVEKWITAGGSSLIASSGCFADSMKGANGCLISIADNFAMPGLYCSFKEPCLVIFVAPSAILVFSPDEVDSIVTVETWSRGIGLGPSFNFCKYENIRMAFKQTQVSLTLGCDARQTNHLAVIQSQV
jgi:hypothetical protein